MPATLELKQCAILEAKSPDIGFGELWGYANVKNVQDSYGDIVADGAYSDLEALKSMGFGALGHDWYGLPIGTIEDAKEDPKGLWFRMAFHSTKQAQDVRTVVDERLARGKDVGLSIGYMVKDAAYETRDGEDVRILKAIKVFEVSVVTVPANDQSLVEGVKGSARGLTLDDQADAALIAVDAYLARIEALKGIREGENRTLSAARVDQASAIHERIAALIDSCKQADQTTAMPLDDSSLRLLELEQVYRRLAS